MVSHELIDVITGAVTVEILPDVSSSGPTQDELRAYAAARRFEIETGGVTVGGSTVSTDRDSQAMITGAYTYVQAFGAMTVPFKAYANGVAAQPLWLVSRTYETAV